MTSTTEHPTRPTPYRPDLAEAWRDWQPMDALLSWLERLRTLLRDTGGMTADDDLLINPMARALLMAAAGTLDRAVPVPPSPVVTVTRATVEPVAPPPETTVEPTRAPKATNRNGHRPKAGEKAPTPVRWTLNDRLMELGYPEELSRGQRVKVGHTVAERYRETHGKAPMIEEACAIATQKIHDDVRYYLLYGEGGKALRAAVAHALAPLTALLRAAAGEEATDGDDEVARSPAS